MKVDQEGKSELESILLAMHPPGPLRKALVHESGERATVIIAEQHGDKYFRYVLSPTAKQILRGHQVVWTEVAGLFTLVEQAAPMLSTVR